MLPRNVWANERRRMTGAVDVIGAATFEELEQKVSDWYAEAAREGFEDSRIPWNPDAADRRGVTSSRSGPIHRTEPV